MPRYLPDPTDLSGDDLTRWYQRSPQEIEDEREAQAARRYNEFYGVLQSNDIESSPLLDRTISGSGADGHIIEIVNPAHPRMRREWEKQERTSWPKTESGRNHDVAHIRAMGDGGTMSLDNIKPMDPAEHRAEHMANGDFGRWGRRSSLARTFGGRVARGIGPFGVLSDLTGLLSGRIRTDTFDNFASDMIGVANPRRPTEGV